MGSGIALEAIAESLRLAINHERLGVRSMTDWKNILPFNRLTSAFRETSTAKIESGAIQEAKFSIEKAWQENLAPIIRNQKFKGSGRNFRQIVDEFALAVNLQGSRYGGKFAINLGVQPLAIPNVLGALPDPKTIKEIECAFRDRLTEDGCDTWWSYDQIADSMRSAAHDAANLFQSKAMDHFHERIRFLSEVTPESIGASVPMTYVSLALLREADGKLDEARAFAQLARDRATSSWVTPNSMKHLLAI
jgi:hypothetical protein